VSTAFDSFAGWLGGDRTRDVRRGDIAVVALSLVVVTVLHLYTDPSQTHLQMLYRRLYYVPILYAAFVFGLRGGLITAVAAGVLFAPTGLMNGADGDLVPYLLDMAMYVTIGGLFGWLTDVEARRTEDLRRVSRQLEQAYSKLEERAVQLIGIQEYTQSILRSITAAVVTVGPDGSIATVNPAAERMLGLSEDVLVPRPIATLFDDDGGLGADLSKVLDGRVPRTMRESTIETVTGREIHVQSSVSRMRDIDGRILGAVVTFEDVSEVKALTEQLIRADRLAALGELTAGVAHEVRNPLGIIRATVQLVEEGSSDRERAEDAGRIIKQEIDRLDKVVKALLDFGRPSRPTLVEVGVEDLLEDVVLFTRKFASSSKVEISEHFHGDLPEVTVDPDQMKQVFVNLISNAVQAMDEGGRIEIATGVDAGYVWITVADNGPGMSDETVAKVFDPFFSTRDEGTGLGLTIVHRIIDEHDGRIEIESVRGEGSAISVFLPVRSSEWAKSRREPEAAVSEEREPDGRESEGRERA
jgi:PAS domain S-box-containing protein